MDNTCILSETVCYSYLSMDAGQAGDNVPPGWKRTMNVRGRIQYESPAPVVNIRSKSQLLRYQKDGKFLELKAGSIVRDS